MNTKGPRMMHLSVARTLVIALACFVAPAAAQAQSVKTRYESALQREAKVRTLIESTAPEASAANRRRVREAAQQVINLYTAIVRRYPASGYADNALFQAGSLSDAMFQRYGRQADREQAVKFFRRVAAEYPSSSLVAKARSLAAPPPQNAAARPAPAPAAPAPAPPAQAPVPAPEATAPSPPASPEPGAAEPEAGNNLPTLTSIDRTVMPEAVRVTMTFDREVGYHEERLSGPPRVFFDVKGVQLVPSLVDAIQSYEADVVRQIRVGRHQNSTVRVVLDLDGVSRYSVFTLYNPFRVVVDAERQAAAMASNIAPAPSAPAAPARAAAPAVPTVTLPAVRALDPAPAAVTPGPEAAAANGAGGFSLARQLGLGVSRIVIDPGHGGHDPGAQVKGLKEADLTLDVALRLEKLLLKEPGVEVVLTRRTNVYIPLEERTAIANRENADLFLSIHANASRNKAARGVETYYLSFASSPEAEAVAARENAASSRTMHNLPDIIKAIALNTKLDESRDLAAMVQEAMVTRLRRSNRNVRNLGVKKAPFVVLIGAGMPSVLAEMSFLTNKDEGALLKTAAYKQRIAESLHEAVMKYRRTLKGVGKVAEQEQ